MSQLTFESRTSCHSLRLVCLPLPTIWVPRMTSPEAGAFPTGRWLRARQTSRDQPCPYSLTPAEARPKVHSTFDVTPFGAHTTRLATFPMLCIPGGREPLQNQACRRPRQFAPPIRASGRAVHTSDDALLR